MMRSASTAGSMVRMCFVKFMRIFLVERPRPQANFDRIIIRQRRTQVEPGYELTVKKLCGNDSSQGHVVRFSQRLPGFDFANELADGGRLKQPGRFPPGGRQHVPDIVVARMSEKAPVDWRPVRAFWTAPDFRREPALSQFPEQVFLGQTTQLQRFRQLIAEFNQPVIEKRKPSFD